MARALAVARSLAFALVVLPMAMGAPAFAQGATPDAPPMERIDRLKVGTLVEFDPRAGTVGEAIGVLLAPVRYHMTTRTVDPQDCARVLRQPVPAIAAHAGVMSIEAAILLLIGEDHRLVVDHVHRLVAIERIPDDADSR
jgi:hypothetical protein